MAKTAPTLAKLSCPKLHRPIQRTRLFALLQERTAPSVAVDHGSAGRREDHAGRHVPARAQASRDLVPGRFGRRGPRDVLPLPGRGRRDLAPAKRTPLPALTPEHLSDLPRFTRRFFRELFSRMPTPSALILDNYQDVHGESALHELIATAVEEMPAGINLIVVSRADPPRELRALARQQCRRPSGVGRPAPDAGGNGRDHRRSGSPRRSGAERAARAIERMGCRTGADARAAEAHGGRQPHRAIPRRWARRSITSRARCSTRVLRQHAISSSGPRASRT